MIENLDQSIHKNKEIDRLIECPICLSPIILPISLSCGHTFCQPCIKHKHFRYVRNVCPTCRKNILLDMNDFSINLAMDAMLRQRFQKDAKYKMRLEVLMASQYPKKSIRIWESLKRRIKSLYPWIIIMLLVYHLVRVKINVFYLLLEKYKDKALKLADSIDKQNSLDFKFLLFSQFMRILFSNMIVH